MERRCHPDEYLALCHICYRYVKNPYHGMPYWDYYSKCKDKQYRMFVDWRNCHAADDLLERIRNVQAPEIEEKTAVVQGEELADKQVQ